MQDPILYFLGGLVGLTVGFPLLAWYCWVLFRLGKQIAELSHSKFSRNVVVVCVCFVWLPLTAISLFIPVSGFGKMALWVIAYLFHAYPTLVGYVYRHQFLCAHEVKRFRKNVDDWLSEWECTSEDADESEDWNSILKSGPDDSMGP